MDSKRRSTGPRPASNARRGQWNLAWDAFYEIDPEWAQAFIVCGAPVYAGDILDPKLAELLSIAFDVLFTHMYAPGVRRHVKAALKLGATIEEIMDVFKLCVAQGVEALNMGIPFWHMCWKGANAAHRRDVINKGEGAAAAAVIFAARSGGGFVFALAHWARVARLTQ